MIRLEFLLEEPSMENVLKAVLPRILPDSYELNKHYFLRPHSGITDLKKSIPTKMRVFSRYPKPVLVIILHDQHKADCVKLKRQLTGLCESNGSCPFLVRIVCRELESWYLGDMEAIEQAYPGFKPAKYRGKARFRDPDLCFAAQEMKKILPGFQKIAASKTIPLYFNIQENKSRSFNQLITGLIRMINILKSKVV